MHALLSRCLLATALSLGLVPPVAAQSINYGPVTRDSINTGYLKVLTPQAGDNAAYLQAAFTGSATLPVELGCGTYTISVPVTIPDNGRVSSAGNFAYGASPVLCAEIVPASSVGFGAGTAVVSLGAYSDMHGVAVRGTAVVSEADGIKLSGSFATADNNRVYNANIGINCVGGTQAHRITRNTVGASKSHGISIPFGCPDTEISRNYVYSSAGDGISLLSTSKVTVAANTVEWSTGKGIALYNGRAVSVEGNQVDRNSGPGLFMQGTAGPSYNEHSVGNSIVGNVFRRNGVAGTAGNNIHVYLVGPHEGLNFAGNTYKSQYENDDNTGTIRPAYVWLADATAALTSTTISDQPPAQATAIYADGTTQTAVQAAQIANPTFGGTGVNNGSYTGAFGGNLVTGGALTFADLATANQLLYTTSARNVGGIAITGLVLGNGASAPSAYTGTSCTNQFPRSLSVAGAATCASVANADLAGSIAAAKLVGTDITTTGALAAGSIASGFGTISTANTISGAGVTSTQALTAGAGWAFSWTGRGILTSPGAGVVQIGNVDVDTGPVAQTLRSQGALTGGTSNVAGANLTVIPSPGKGTGIGGDLIVQTAPAGGSGSTPNTPVTRLTVANTGLVTLGSSTTPTHVATAQTTAPALTSCGTGSPAITGTDVAGIVTMGTNATGCIITFNVAYTGTPFCVVSWIATPLASQSYVTSNTAITLTQTSTSGNKAQYHCMAPSGG